MDDLTRNRLLDMKEHAQEAIQFVGDMSAADFKNSPITYHAVTRCVEIIGEAANHIDPKFRGQHEGIPWREIRGTRNLIAHAYMRVDLDIVYNVIQTELPSLISYLDKILEDKS